VTLAGRWPPLVRQTLQHRRRTLEVAPTFASERRLFGSQSCVLIRETFELGEDEETQAEDSVREIQMSQPVFEALKRQFETTGKLSASVFRNCQGQPIDNKHFRLRLD
jgi:hypothetical protein